MNTFTLQRAGTNVYRVRQTRLASIIALILVVCSACTDDSDWRRFMEAGTQAERAGNLHQAEQWFQAGLAEAKRFGTDDVRYAQSLQRLADLYQRLERYDLAASHYWQALPAWAQSVGPEDPHMAESLRGLAFIYEARGRLQLAAPLLKRALHIQEKAYGFVHPNLVSTLTQYRTLLLKQRKIEEARTIDQRLAAIGRGGR